MTRVFVSEQIKPAVKFSIVTAIAAISTLGIAGSLFIVFHVCPIVYSCTLRRAIKVRRLESVFVSLLSEFHALCAVYSKTIATGCLIQYNRSKRHGDARNGALAKVSPEDRQALANLQVRTEARLNARLAWQ